MHTPSSQEKILLHPHKGQKLLISSDMKDDQWSNEIFVTSVWYFSSYICYMRNVDSFNQAMHTLSLQGKILLHPHKGQKLIIYSQVKNDHLVSGELHYCKVTRCKCATIRGYFHTDVFTPGVVCDVTIPGTRPCRNCCGSDFPSPAPGIYMPVWKYRLTVLCGTLCMLIPQEEGKPIP